ncbi:ExbD/TolR family protein [Herbaspirillum rubrisubalbicans]|nr:biopolymer transporter ExbD [Herbaspirillum rubrisubalbicans]ALU89471.1 biopolymer transport ExbD/TolR protein [Herbaspirillum rubrisubalbicans M1]
MSMMNDAGGDGLATEINMTPLIDVMLVLLIIFIVTLPAINQAVKVTLPKATAQPTETASKDIDISIQADGTVLWNRVPANLDELRTRVAAAAAAAVPPAVNVYADEKVPYGSVARVLAGVQSGGLTKINFVTEPVKDTQ